MLEKDPVKRITTKEALNHEFLSFSFIEEGYNKVGEEILDGEKLGKLVFKE